MYSLIKRVASRYKFFWKPLAAVSALIMCQKIGDLLVPVFGGRVIDAMTQHHALASVHLLVLIAFLFWVCHGNILPYLLGLIDVSQFRFAGPRKISVDNLRIVAAGAAGPGTGRDTAMQQAVIERGEQVLMGFIDSLVRVAIPLFLPGIATLAFLLWYYPLIGLIAVTGGALDVLATVWLNRKLAPRYARLQVLDYERQRLQTQFFRDVLVGGVGHQAGPRIAEYDRRYGEFATHGVKTGLQFLGFNAGRGLIVNVTNLLTWLVGAWYVDAGVYSLGYFLASLSWSAYVLNVLGAAIDLQRQWMETVPAIHRFFGEIDACQPAGPGPGAAVAVVVADDDGDRTGRPLVPALGRA